MPGPVRDYLFEDHARLERQLDEATRGGTVDLALFEPFRRGLLRHIGLEEKLVLPAARKANGGVDVDEFPRLRADHGRLTALLVPTPTIEIVTKLRAILAPHDELEERAGGVYERCEALVGAEASAELAVKLREAPEVRTRPHTDARRPKLLDD